MVDRDNLKKDDLQVSTCLQVPFGRIKGVRSLFGKLGGKPRFSLLNLSVGFTGTTLRFKVPGAFLRFDTVKNKSKPPEQAVF